jgi:hypothetical protein
MPEELHIGVKTSTDGTEATLKTVAQSVTDIGKATEATKALTRLFAAA